MHRKIFLSGLFGSFALPFVGCSDAAGPNSDDERERPELYKPKSEWRRLLSPAAFAVLFEESTEPPGSSPLDKEFRSGTYLCAACFIPLFASETKYETGTGWPSFWEPMIPERLGFMPDYKLLLPRTEYHCRRCGGHHGHVFDDGPLPTGKRYCNNGLALLFIPTGESLPALRT